MEKQINTPKLRFPEFDGEWESLKIGEVFSLKQRPMSKPKEFYKSIGIRSHFKGTFQRIDSDPLKNVMDVLYQVKENDLIVNITFAWEGAVAIASKADESGYVSHRFPTYEIDNSKANIDFFRFIYPTAKMKKELELISPGGAGRNRVLKKEEFLKINFCFPTLPEQTRIANFLTAVDNKLTQLKKKKSLLEQYKKGVMQKLFSQELRFKDERGNDFAEWEEKKLGEILNEHKTRNKNNKVKEVFSVAKNKGVINQIEHLGRSYASADTSNYKIVFPNDVIYTKSPTSDFPFGIIKQNKLDRKGIVSVLYGVFTPKNSHIGLLLDYYFSCWKNIYNYLNPLVQKGAKNTMNIGNEDFLNGAELLLPSSEAEQIKIARFLVAIDDKICHCGVQIEKMERWKKGLSQKMFC